MGVLQAFLVYIVASFVLDGCLASYLNVISYGAVGDGQRDDTQAFLKAWGDLCGQVGETPTLIIPSKRTFLLSPVKFQGPCKSSSVRIQVLGTIVAPKSIDDWKNCEGDSWIYFSMVQGLDIHGSGMINGHGEQWWPKASYYSASNQIQAKTGNCVRPTGVHFYNCNGLRLSGITNMNSPRNHICINTCEDVKIFHIKLLAPESSPNTDGIDISASHGVQILNSLIATGDDCVALNGGSFNINISGVACGPGHGISVGSLGGNGQADIVRDVYVRGCRFTRTQNGARIKTWPGGSGSASNIHFEDITLVDVKNPIIIDQYYCNGEYHCQNEKGSTAVQVRDVFYRNVKGSTTGNEAINLDCSKIVGCKNIVMELVNITSAIPGSQIYASCTNAIGTSSSTSPTVPCLS